MYDLGFTDFLAALINGYEVEKTPEEKVREYYESYGVHLAQWNGKKPFKIRSTY
ncbi:hypothetical protein QKW52_15165 [Bacillus sonorensis]|nr:hypothetical protein [Bacillus sonorensis]MDI3411035.1 hypothetical protein [Bacillus sonorensis]